MYSKHHASHGTESDWVGWGQIGADLVGQGRAGSDLAGLGQAASGRGPIGLRWVTLDGALSGGVGRCQSELGWARLKGVGFG